MTSLRHFRLGLLPFTIMNIVAALVLVIGFQSLEAFMSNTTVWLILTPLFVVTLVPRIHDTGLSLLASWLWGVVTAALILLFLVNQPAAGVAGICFWTFAAMMPADICHTLGRALN
ncbi:hypothetical protein [Carnimonas nigrificans]|uniref:hypothetical protein n=1 Tax=Carnimonas nigrificans TaxID=64323 RepID=UPI000471E111|nr:hypothetical protein [Carnimonas nigrificans]